jgi:hypothetical protein
MLDSSRKRTDGLELPRVVTVSSSAVTTGSKRLMSRSAILTGSKRLMAWGGAIEVAPVVLLLLLLLLLRLVGVIVAVAPGSTRWMAPVLLLLRLVLVIVAVTPGSKRLMAWGGAGDVSPVLLLRLVGVIVLQEFLQGFCTSSLLL